MITADLSISAYHAQPHASTTKLKTLAERGPRGYFLAHIQRTIVDEDKPAFLVGRAIEDAVQRPAFFREHYTVAPEGTDRRTKDGKAWFAQQEAQGREVLSRDDAACISALTETLTQCPVAQQMIEAATAQLSIVHDTTPWPSIPGIQSRPDWLCLDGCAASDWRPYVLDLKSTTTLAQLSTGRSILRYGYHKQAALVRMTLELEGVDVRGMRFLLLGAEKAIPHRWRVIEIPGELLAAGEQWCRDQLDQLERCYAAGEWPLVEGEIVRADVPEWLDVEDAA